VLEKFKSEPFKIQSGGDTTGEQKEGKKFYALFNQIVSECEKEDESKKDTYERMTSIDLQPEEIRQKFMSNTTPATPMKSRVVTPINATIRDELKAKKIKQKERSLKKQAAPRKIFVQDL